MGRDILNLSTKQLDRGISCVEFYRGNIAEISRKKKMGTEVPDRDSQLQYVHNVKMLYTY